MFFDSTLSPSSDLRVLRDLRGEKFFRRMVSLTIDQLKNFRKQRKLLSIKVLNARTVN
jgi:hypothetical protein